MERTIYVKMTTCQDHVSYSALASSTLNRSIVLLNSKLSNNNVLRENFRQEFYIT